MSWLTDLALSAGKAVGNAASGRKAKLKPLTRAAQAAATAAAIWGAPKLVTGAKKVVDQYGYKVQDEILKARQALNKSLGFPDWTPDYMQTAQDKGEDYAESKGRALKAVDDERAQTEWSEDRSLLDTKKFPRSKPLKRKTVVDDDWARGGVGSGGQTWEDFFG